MTSPRTFQQRIGFFQPCVALATILSNAPLRTEEDGTTPLTLHDEASCDDLCYLRVIRRLTCADLYQAEVAATIDSLKTRPVLAFFTEEQLRSTAVYDTRFHGKDTDLIRERLEAHIEANKPTVRIDPEQQKRPVAPEPAVALQTLDVPIEVTEECLQDALEAITPAKASKSGKMNFVSPFHMQQAFLCAAIDMLMDKLYRSTEQINHFAVKTNCALIAQVQRWHRSTHQRCVHVIKRTHTWQLVIGVPEHLLQVA